MYTFIQGDSLKVLSDFKDKSFDITLTSPPFKDEDVAVDYWDFYRVVMDELFRVTKNVVIIIHSSTKMNQIIQEFPPKRTLIWSKGLVKYSWRYNPIFVYQMHEDYKVNKYIWSDTFGIPPIVGGNLKQHKYQDPTVLYVTLLKMFRENNNSVLDPFIGSGTTAKASSQLNMDCTGIDLVDYRSVKQIKGRGDQSLPYIKEEENYVRVIGKMSENL